MFSQNATQTFTKFLHWRHKQPNETGHGKPEWDSSSPQDFCPKEYRRWKASTAVPCRITSHASSTVLQQQPLPLNFITQPTIQWQFLHPAAITHSQQVLCCALNTSNDVTSNRRTRTLRLADHIECNNILMHIKQTDSWNFKQPHLRHVGTWRKTIE